MHPNFQLSLQPYLAYLKLINHILEPNTCKRQKNAERACERPAFARRKGRRNKCSFYNVVLITTDKLDVSAVCLP